MTTLGALMLSDHLILDGLENHAGVVVSQRRTLGGVSRLHVDPAPGGRTLSLTGDKHFTLAQVQAMQAVAGTGYPLQLVHHRGTFTVIISDVEVDQSIRYADPDGNTWYSGTITLIEV